MGMVQDLLTMLVSDFYFFFGYMVHYFGEIGYVLYDSSLGWHINKFQKNLMECLLLYI